MWHVGKHEEYCGEAKKARLGGERKESVNCLFTEIALFLP